MPILLPARNQPMIPRQDEALNRFATNFYVNLDDTLWSLPIGTRAQLNVDRLNFNDKLALINRTLDRTTATIAEKNAARIVLVTNLRSIIRIGKANVRGGTMPGFRLLRCGVKLAKTTITQEPAPGFAPGLILESQTAYLATLRLIQTTNRGSNTNTRLPTGVQNVQLLQQTTNNGLHLIRSFTKPLIRVPLENFAPGSDIVVVVRYLGSRQEPGPISQSLTIHIPA